MIINLLFIICILTNFQDTLYAMEEIDQEINILDATIKRWQEYYILQDKPEIKAEASSISLDSMFLDEKCELIKKLQNEKAELISKINKTDCLVSLKLNITDIDLKIIKLDRKIHRKTSKYNSLIFCQPMSEVLHRTNYPLDKMFLNEKCELIKKLQNEKAELKANITIARKIINLEEEILKYDSSEQPKSEDFQRTNLYTMSSDEKNKLLEKLRNKKSEIDCLTSLNLSNNDFNTLLNFCNNKQQIGTIAINNTQSYLSHILSILNQGKLLFYYPLGWKTNWYNYYKNIIFVSPSKEMIEYTPFLPIDIKNEIEKQLQKIKIPENHRIKIIQEEITSNNISSFFWPHGYDVEVQGDLVIHNIKLDPKYTSFDPEIQKFLIAKLMIQPTRNLRDNSNKLFKYKLFYGSLGTLALGCAAYFISHETNPAFHLFLSCLGGLIGMKKAIKNFEKEEITEINETAQTISEVSPGIAKKALNIKPGIKNSWNMKSQEGKNIKVVEIIPIIPEE